MQSIVALSRTLLPASSATRSKIGMGISLTLCGGSSTFFHAENILVSQKSCLPAWSSRGSLAPMLGNFWLTKQMVSSTERALLELPLGEMRPSRQRRPKTWRIETGLATDDRKGSTLIELQNATQTFHVDCALAVREDTTPAATVFSASWRSARRASWAEGGAFSKCVAVDKWN